MSQTSPRTLGRFSLRVCFWLGFFGPLTADVVDHIGPKPVERDFIVLCDRQPLVTTSLCLLYYRFKKDTYLLGPVTCMSKKLVTFI